MSLKKCFGIISYLPNEQVAREQRLERLNRSLNQISSLWPDTGILIIAQNWKGEEHNCKNKCIIKYYEPLGILKARKTLREEFLKLDYDYMIMADDDIIIECKDENAPKEFFDKMDENPKGFCCLTYKAAQLNLLSVSRYIYEREPICDIDPEKSEGFEDNCYVCLLHTKYASLEWTFDKIKCTQFNNPNEKAPSTWAGRHHYNWNYMVKKTKAIEDYIRKHKKMPPKETYVNVPYWVKGTEDAYFDLDMYLSNNNLYNIEEE